MMTVAGFAAAIVGLQDATQNGLQAKFAAAGGQYIGAQNALINSQATVNQCEKAAYAVSDQIAPKYLYDNCGRYQ